MDPFHPCENVAHGPAPRSDRNTRENCNSSGSNSPGTPHPGNSSGEGFACPVPEMAHPTLHPLRPLPPEMAPPTLHPLRPLPSPPLTDENEGPVLSPLMLPSGAQRTPPPRNTDKVRAHDKGEDKQYFSFITTPHSAFCDDETHSWFASEMYRILCTGEDGAGNGGDISENRLFDFENTVSHYERGLYVAHKTVHDNPDTDLYQNIAEITEAREEKLLESINTIELSTRLAMQDLDEERAQALSDRMERIRHYLEATLYSRNFYFNYILGNHRLMKKSLGDRGADDEIVRWKKQGMESLERARNMNTEIINIMGERNERDGKHRRSPWEIENEEWKEGYAARVREGGGRH